MNKIENEFKRLSIAAKSNSFHKKKELIEFIEDHKLRKPDEVVETGLALIHNYESKLGDDVWDLYETVFKASLDSSHPEERRDDVQQTCIQILSTRFPGSIRVKVLQGMQAEAFLKFNDALSVYDSILEEDECNVVAMKRKVAVYKAKGDTKGAIAALNEYLGIFCGDADGWQELGALYIKIGHYDLAKFCYEELITIIPENYLYHLQYAELLYTIGGKINFEIARQSYAQSLELNPGCMRAMLGLAMCLRVKAPSTGPERLYEMVTEKIMTAYSQVPKGDNQHANRQNAILVKVLRQGDE